MIEKVISGGQTGVDRIALEVAKKLGIPTGGMAPKDYWTEKGPDPTLKEFGLTEDTNRGYLTRTIHNLMNSDATVIYGDATSPGSHQTIQYCQQYMKPYLINPPMEEFVGFMIKNNVKILNIAGNRASRLNKTKWGMAEIEAILMFSLTEANKLIK